MKYLIVKLGAAGDVVRTTPILPYLKGDIYWLTLKLNACFLRRSKYIKKIFIFEFKKNLDDLKKIDFDIIISLDDDVKILKFLNCLRTKRLIGAYFDIKKQRPFYTKESYGWFDMSLISRLGIKKADKLKKINKKTYQYYLFKMIELKFFGQPYLIDHKLNKKPKYAVGIEKRAGLRWPSKIWGGYDRVIEKLKNKKIPFFIFKQRADCRKYIDDINNCKIIICGDTLAMHLGLALNKKVIALFSPTPPQEIYHYNNLIKFYNSKTPCFCSYKAYCLHNPHCIDCISVNSVFQKIQELL